MKRVQIQCPIPVKALMTERLRAELYAAETASMEDVEHQLEMLNSFSPSQGDIFERQRQLLAQQAEIESRAARINEAPEGQEFLLRVVHSVLEIGVGDNFLEAMSTEILLENGVVTALRTLASGSFAEPQSEPEPLPVS